jgi:hypothetical protein
LAERWNVSTLVNIILTVDASEAFRAVASNGGRFRQVSTSSTVLAPVVHGTVVDRGLADRAVEAVGALTSEAVGEIDARSPVDAGGAQAFVDVLACQACTGSNFCKKNGNLKAF